MSDKRIVLNDPITGDRLFPAGITDNLYNPDGSIFSPARIETGSYVGTGTYGPDNPNILTFEFVPKLVFITTQDSALLAGNYFRAILFSGLMVGMSEASGADIPLFSTLMIQWEGNSVSWYNNYSVDGPSAQLNANAKTYNYIAIGI